MDMADMVYAMRFVQAYEGAGCDAERLAAADTMCRAVRALVEEHAELCGRYTELMERIGEE